MLLLSFEENFRMGITSFGDSAHPPCHLWASQNEHWEGVGVLNFEQTQLAIARLSFRLV